MKQLLEKMETVSRNITEKRSSVTFTPKDLEEVTKWENSLPESALTKYFNTWIKIHRSVAAAQSAAQEEEEKEQGEEGIMEDSGSDEDDEEEEEVEKKPASSPKKKVKKAKKLKIKDTDSANSAVNTNGLSSDVSSPDKKKKKKKKKGKEKKPVVDENAEFVDNGDLVEDIVLSD